MPARDRKKDKKKREREKRRRKPVNITGVVR